VRRRERRCPVPSPDQPPEVFRAPRSGLILMVIIVAALALVALYANVQKGRRDKIEKVEIVPVSPTPAASPAGHD
jgi:hypothetical protein